MSVRNKLLLCRKVSGYDNAPFGTRNKRLVYLCAFNIGHRIETMEQNGLMRTEITKG
jgi:hypothetical protein